MNVIMAYLHRWRESHFPGPDAPACGLRGAWRALLARIPADCPLCQGRSRGGRLCPGCLADVTFSVRNPSRRCPACMLDLGRFGHCPDCALQPPAFDRVLAAFDYAPPGDLLIQYFKARRRFVYARMLSEMLARTVKAAAPALPGHTILVPVPASRASIRMRGFNPAAEIARYLAQPLHWAYRPDLLLRAREGARQARLTRGQRARSAQHLYTCPVRVERASIAVVDDVLTTGSTLNAIAREFRAAGAASVVGLVLARTPYPGQSLLDGNHVSHCSGVARDPAQHGQCHTPGGQHGGVPALDPPPGFRSRR